MIKGSRTNEETKIIQLDIFSVWNWFFPSK